MKFIHLSDLHLGKRLNEFSLIEDQEFVLQEIYSIISEEKPDSSSSQVMSMTSPFPQRRR